MSAGRRTQAGNDTEQRHGQHNAVTVCCLPHSRSHKILYKQIKLSRNTDQMPMTSMMMSLDRGTKMYKEAKCFKKHVLTLKVERRVVVFFVKHKVAY